MRIEGKQQVLKFWNIWTALVAGWTESRCFAGHYDSDIVLLQEPKP
jgi:hypothetical protein